MEPLAALGIATNIIQILDFGARILSRSHEIYQSAEGRIDEHVLLDSAANTLADLYDGLIAVETPDPRFLTKADQTLVKLKYQSEATIKQLRQVLEEARMKGKHSKWRSVFEALRSTHSEKQVTRLSNELETIRKHIDTALLVVLAQRMKDLGQHRTDDCSAGDHPQRTASKSQVKQDATMLNAVYSNKWQVSQSHDVDAFSQRLNQLTSVDLKARFCKTLLARLDFPHMRDRQEIIPNAHAETFEWLFHATPFDVGVRASDFKEWIKRDGDGIYWITGKPGSGKSTLMKFLFSHHCLDNSLSQWAHPGDTTKAGFYFWNSGSIMQMSQVGMLQTLLHTCLRDRNDLITSLFKDRWEQYRAFGGGQHPFSWLELKRALGQVISDQTRKFFLLIDGLDEFEGEPKDMIELLLGLVRPNVKMCLASRPWLPFEDAFKSRPNLLLEQLTKQDIQKYVTGTLGQNEHYSRLGKDDAPAAETLIGEVVKKASGVFLWVRLVIHSLLQGLSNSDRMSDLQARLEALPSNLEALFNRLLEKLEPGYFREACELFRLLRAYRELYGQKGAQYNNPTLLQLFYADDPKPHSCLTAPWKPLSPDEAANKSDQMRRRLVARCKCLLDGSFTHGVTYLHRTARDYVELSNYWEVVMQATSHELFEPDKRWANSHIWVHKAHPYPHNRSIVFESSVIRTVHSAFTVQVRTGKVPKTYLDEVFRMEYSYGFQITTSRLEHATSYLRQEPRLFDYLAVLVESAKPAERTAFIEKHKSDNHQKGGSFNEEQWSRLLQIVAPDKKFWKSRLRYQSPPSLEYE